MPLDTFKCCVEWTLACRGWKLVASADTGPWSDERELLPFGIIECSLLLYDPFDRPPVLPDVDVDPTARCKAVLVGKDDEPPELEAGGG